MSDERRNNVELKVIAERLGNLSEKQEMSETASCEWRNRFCAKLDVITDKLNNLPCDVRVERSKNIHFQLKALWAVTGGMVLAIISEWIKWK